MKDWSVQPLLTEMTAWRRALHRNPELSYREEKTAGFIAGLLASWGIEARTGVGGHGVVADIGGTGRGRTVALRADIDALPIQDAKTCEYASQVPGVMHACGHDAHTATLLGIAHTLKARENELAGTVRLLFQPAEEISPGGALPMIRDGALEGVETIYGVHLWTPFPSGHVYSRPGPLMAAADEFQLRVIGKGGHGGLPHEAVDSIVTAAHAVVQLQSIVSRSVDPTEPCVVSIGSIRGGTGFNIIAESVELIGTVRTFSEPVRALVERRIGEIAAAVCASFGAGHRYDFKRGYPPVVNDAKEADRFFRIAGEVVGRERVHEAPLIMAGEDFAYYLQQVPGCFVFVGAGDRDKGFVHPHHHPQFDLDEGAMATAGDLLLGLALDALRSPQP